jgi:hypothetical protein
VFFDFNLLQKKCAFLLYLFRSVFAKKYMETAVDFEMESEVEIILQEPEYEVSCAILN